MAEALTGEICAEMRLTGVFVDLETRRSTPFPDAMRQAAASLLTEAN